ncbi:hypothetical protein [Nocardioides sp.]|uniref:hypothetical protein n=1 Tax=Nocardioides sp. TaxID=35761 RepID=UPI003514D618
MSSDPLVWQNEYLRRGTAAWEDQIDLMTTAAGELGRASVTALPPSAQGSAATFLERWSGYAQESAAIARGFHGALRATADDYSTADDATDRRFSDLDGRLGPAR